MSRPDSDEGKSEEAVTSIGAERKCWLLVMILEL
jgi:hypothetical protein